MHEGGGGDSEFSVEASDHGEAELSLVVEDFGDFAFVADVGDEVFLPQAHLVHAKADGFDGVGGFDGVVLFFVLLDEEGPEFEVFFLAGTGFGFHERFHEGESLLVIFFGANDFGFHGGLRWFRHRSCRIPRGCPRNECKRFRCCSES